MKRQKAVRHEFVEHIPEKLVEGTLYVSIPFGTAVHKCCCGCGNEVVTPLSPTDWKLIYDGVSVSLDPSVGNWSFPCKSHYWIRRSKIEWALAWTQQQINSGRAHDHASKQNYFSPLGANGGFVKDQVEDKGTVWSKLKNWWSSEQKR